MWRDRKRCWVRLRTVLVMGMGGPPPCSPCLQGPLVAWVCLQAFGPVPQNLRVHLTGSHFPIALYVELFVFEGERYFERLLMRKQLLKAEALSTSAAYICNLCIVLHAQYSAAPGFYSEPGHRTESSADRSVTDLAWIIAALYVSTWISEIPERDRCCVQQSSGAERAVCQRHTVWSLSPRRGRRQRACQYSSSRMLW